MDTINVMDIVEGQVVDAEEVAVVAEPAVDVVVDAAVAAGKHRMEVNNPALRTTMVDNIVEETRARTTTHNTS